MHLLFVLYHDMTCNSAQHVRALAAELAKKSHTSSCLCVPHRVPAFLVPLPESEGIPSDSRTLGLSDSRNLRLSDSRNLGLSDSRTPDVIIAWTPRENVRRAALAILRRHPHARLIVHLEDNEDSLTARYLGISTPALRHLCPWNPLAWRRLRALRGLPLSLPWRMRHFLCRADAISMVAPELADFVPPGKPSTCFAPGFDESLFLPPLPSRDKARTALGVPADTAVLAYTGNIHRGNADDMAMLYASLPLLAARLAPRPVLLLRTGENHAGPDFTDLVRDAAPLVRELGFVPRQHLPTILAAADVLVQPGGPGEFNDFRFPSKLPDFLASGRPVILGRTNLGCHLPANAAIILGNPTPSAMTDAAAALLAAPARAADIGAAGRAWALEHLRWSRAAETFSRILT